MSVFGAICVVVVSVGAGCLMALYWLVGRDRRQVLPVRDVAYSIQMYVPNLVLRDDYRRPLLMLVIATVILGAAVLMTAMASMNLLPARWIGAAWAIPVICLGCDLGYRSTRYKLPYQGQLGILCALWASALGLSTYQGKMPDAMPFYLIMSFILLFTSFVAWVAGKGRDRYYLTRN